MKKSLLVLCFAALSSASIIAQDKLYPQAFSLGDVVLLDGCCKHAQDININTLLQYNVDRLLAPYLKEAGLTPKGSSYSNWIDLDGHIGGHYLSALAIHYAATGNAICKERMDYMVTELKACQTANSTNANFVGYVGGVPNGKSVWLSVKVGTPTAVTSVWVPWYNLHKTYAGLRDAWMYGGNEDAKTVFLAFCDWAISITSTLTDAQMESMLATEHGGINESLADAYQMTADVKYLTAAKRFSHKTLLNSMAAKSDNLDNMHANTQVPKAIGFQRIGALSANTTYRTAASFFWETVTTKRTLALGGNSRNEYFPATAYYSDFVNSVQGPESCNTNNMLKLTEDLFYADPQAKYADFYEKALFNHILSTQHPEHGGYVYFTPARPRHYRVYSAPNQAMWCCVGTGMENHGKYGEFIYSHFNGDSLYVNLFVPSELNWKAKGVTVKQETTFPDEEKTQLTISVSAPTTFELLIRHPKWVATNALVITVNDQIVSSQSTSSTYVRIEREWNNGDVVKVALPMQNTIEKLPNVATYIAIMHGPILLGAKTGTEEMTGLVADDSRWGHIAGGSLLPLNEAPITVGDAATFPSKIIPIEGKPLTFTAPGLFVTKADSALVLEPFFRIHDSRYMMYWMNLTAAQYQAVLAELAAQQKLALDLANRTIDQVAPGQQQPEVDHEMLISNSYTGNHQNEFWRDARNGGYISYKMYTANKSDLSLMVRYWGNESGSRSFNILIDGVKLTTENIVGKWNRNEFVNVEYPIPNTMTAGKDSVTVLFQAINTSNVVGGLFYVRLLQPVSTTKIDISQADPNRYKFTANNGEIIVSGIEGNALVSVFDTNGRLVARRKGTGNKVAIPVSGGLYVVLIMDGKGNFVQKVMAE